MTTQISARRSIWWHSPVVCSLRLKVSALVHPMHLFRCSDIAIGAGSGARTAEGRKDKLRSKQTHMGALDTEVNSGTSLRPVLSGWRCNLWSLRTSSGGLVLAKWIWNVAGTGSAQGRKDNPRHKQTHKSALDPEVKCCVSLTPGLVFSPSATLFQCLELLMDLQRAYNENVYNLLQLLYVPYINEIVRDLLPHITSVSTVLSLTGARNIATYKTCLKIC